jgi:hypothetical protein
MKEESFQRAKIWESLETNANKLKFKVIFGDTIFCRVVLNILTHSLLGNNLCKKIIKNYQIASEIYTIEFSKIVLTLMVMTKKYLNLIFLHYVVRTNCLSKVLEKPLKNISDF